MTASEAGLATPTAPSAAGSIESFGFAPSDAESAARDGDEFSDGAPLDVAPLEVAL